MGLQLKPITVQDAKPYIARHHRHNKSPQSGLCAVSVVDGENLVGVAVLGRPSARALQDGYTAEITRNTTEGHLNACSMLYGALLRVAKALGYHRVYTYTLKSESGSSLRAVGFLVDAELQPRPTWNCQSRPRRQVDLFGNQQRPVEAKIRWVWYCKNEKSCCRKEGL